MLELITGDELYAYVGGTGTPTADDAAFLELIAASVNGAADRHLEYPTDTALLPAGCLEDMHRGALAIGAEQWKRREAPFGIAGFDVSGGAVRLSADDLRAGRSAWERWAPTGGVGVA